MKAAMRIFELSKRFPIDERYSLTDQIRRASRSVCSNLGEAWRKRRYSAYFVSKLNESDGEAEETRVWLEFSWRCGYMSRTDASELDQEYSWIIGQLVRMIESTRAVDNSPSKTFLRFHCVPSPPPGVSPSPPSPYCSCARLIRSIRRALPLASSRSIIAAQMRTWPLECSALRAITDVKRAITSALFIPITPS